jgi:glycosyltransferase involved in cell wall biosynthesis
MKQKIVIIMFLPRFIVSGAGRSVFELIKNLNKKKFSINVICFKKCEYKSKIKKFGNIFEINVNRILFSFNKILNITNQIIKRYSNNKIIFVSNIHYANILAFFLKLKLKKIKIIGIERTAISELEIFYSLNDYIKKIIVKLFVRLVYQKFDKIVANCKYVENEIKKFSSKNTMTIHPSAYLENKKINEINDNLNILIIGRLSKEKGIDLALKALSKIKNKFILTIVGRGSDKKKLINLSKKYFGKNYKTIIRFAGHHKNLHQFYSRSNVFLNTSHFEGFSNAIIDAMNYGVPIIASNCPGGNSEILQNGKYGLLFKSKDHNDLKLKILKFLNNKKSFQKKAKFAKEYIKIFSKEESMKKYSNLFKKI